MYDLSEIKSRLTCVEYARSQGLPIHKPGDRCASPFHAGKNPTSLVVYDDFWYSHSDATGGDVIDLCAMLRHDGNRGYAIRELAALTGATEPANAAAWRNYTQNLGNAVAAWHQKLTTDDRDYLHSRGITDETINTLMLGRCTAPGHRGRLVIPYWKNGYVAYYATRERPGCQSADAKYKKQTTDDFNEHVVWGLDTLSRSGDTLIIAEGAFDALSFWQQGYPVISAITGMFSAQQLPTVLSAARNFKRVFMVYDNDPRTHAGAKFTLRMARILATHRIPFTVGLVPHYHDVSEYYAAGGDLAELVASGTQGVEYLLTHDTELSNAARYTGAICDYLNSGYCDAVTNLILDSRASTADIEAFMYSIARYTRRERLAFLFDQLTRQGEYNPRWLQNLLKSVSQAPSERTVADAIREKHQLIYCTGTGFYEYASGVWTQQDDLVIRNYAIQYLGVYATDQRARAATGLLKSMCLADVTFNTAHVWNFVNGTLELDTGTFRPANPLDYCSIQMRYPYNPDAPCTAWQQFIRDVTADDEKSMELLQFLAGYVLYSDCSLERIFYLVGGGANGKSKFLDILVRLFGEANCTSLSPSALTKDFQLAQLHGSVLNICEEISGSLDNTEELLKSLSSGGIQNACFKHMPYFDFRNRAKLVFASNEPPSSRDTSDGMARRLIIVNFPVKFVENPDPTNPYERQRRTDVTAPLLQELATGGIFNWCYEGYRLLRQVGYFTETDDQEQLMEDFREVSNPLLVFWREQIEPAPPPEIGTVELYQQYRSWCDANGNMPLSRSRFHVEFKRVCGGTYQRGERTVKNGEGLVRKHRFYLYLRLRDYTCDYQ